MSLEVKAAMEAAKLVSELVKEKQAAGEVTEVRTEKPLSLEERYQRLIEATTRETRTTEKPEVTEAKLKLEAFKKVLERKEINPGYERDLKRKVNCGSCAFAVWKRLNGRDLTAVAERKNIARRDIDMERLTGLRCVYMDPEKIEEILKSRGPGSNLIVGINRTEGAGHWFNVFYDGEKISVLEGQSGNVFEWPHDYGKISAYCALV